MKYTTIPAIVDNTIINKNSIDTNFTTFLFMLTPQYNYIGKNVINQLIFHIIY